MPGHVLFGRQETFGDITKYLFRYLLFVENRARDAPETRLILFLRLLPAVDRVPAMYTPAGFLVLGCTYAAIYR